MSLPQIPEYTVPLLLEVERAGGVARASDIYDRVLSHFPPGLISASDLNERQGSGREGRYKNLIQNARELLKQSEDIEARQDGVWPITAKGRQTLRRILAQEHRVPSADVEHAIASDLKLHEIDASWQPKVTGAARTATRKRGVSRVTVAPVPQSPAPPGSARTSRSTSQPFVPGAAAPPVENKSSLSQLITEHFEELKQRLSEQLCSLSSEQFEHAVAQLLIALGYQDVRRTGGPGDRNVDVTATYAPPFVKMPLRVQVKHRQSSSGTVGPTDVAAFRDRAGGVDHVLLMVTNGRFTDGALETASEQGRQGVFMIDGEHLVSELIDKKIGVKDGPLGVLETDDEFFAQFEGIQ